MARKLVGLVLDSQINEANACFDNLRTRAWPAFDEWVREQPGSRRDYLREIWEFGQQIALIVASSGFDHAEALRHSLEDPRGGTRLWSYRTLARAASEAFVRAAVLSDRTVSPESSVVRTAAATLDGWLKQVELARDFATVDPTHGASALEESNRAVATELQRISRAGLLVIRDKQERPLAVMGPTVSATVDLDLTAESNHRLAAIPRPYRLGSGAGHSGSKLLTSGAVANGDGLCRPELDMNALGSAIVLMLESLCALVESLAAEQAVSDCFRTGTERRKRLIFSTLGQWHQSPAEDLGGPASHDGTPAKRGVQRGLPG